MSDVFLWDFAALLIMQSGDERILELVAATLIDARSALEQIEPPDREINQIHGEITRAHALCWQVLANLRTHVQTAASGK